MKVRFNVLSAELGGPENQENPTVTVQTPAQNPDLQEQIAKALAELKAGMEPEPIKLVSPTLDSTRSTYLPLVVMSENTPNGDARWRTI